MSAAWAADECDVVGSAAETWPVKAHPHPGPVTSGADTRAVADNSTVGITGAVGAVMTVPRAGTAAVGGGAVTSERSGVVKVEGGVRVSSRVGAT